MISYLFNELLESLNTHTFIINHALNFHRYVMCNNKGDMDFGSGEELFRMTDHLLYLSKLFRLLSLIKFSLYMRLKIQTCMNKDRQKFLANLILYSSFPWFCHAHSHSSGIRSGQVH